MVRALLPPYKPDMWVSLSLSLSLSLIYHLNVFGELFKGQDLSSGKKIFQTYILDGGVFCLFFLFFLVVVFMLSLRPLLKSNIFECDHSIFVILKLYILLYLKRKPKKPTKNKKQTRSFIWIILNSFSQECIVNLIMLIQRKRVIKNYYPGHLSVMFDLKWLFDSF